MEGREASFWFGLTAVSNPPFGGVAYRGLALRETQGYLWAAE
jgi:hypothetical protein